jgi:hypothetical protein
MEFIAVNGRLTLIKWASWGMQFDPLGHVNDKVVLSNRHDKKRNSFDISHAFAIPSGKLT